MILLKTLLITLVLILLAFAGIAIKILLRKNGQFQAKSCCRENKTSGGCGCHH